MINKKLRQIIKKIPFSKILYTNFKFFFMKLLNFSNFKNIYFLSNLLLYIKLQIDYLKIQKEPKIIEKIISSSSFKDYKQLFKFIDKAIYYQRKILIQLDDGLNKCDEYFLLGRLYFYKGDMKNFIKYFDEERLLRERLLKNSIYKESNDIFIARNTIHVLGLIGHLDGLIKFIRLNNLNIKINIIGDKKTIINDYYFSLYEKYLNFIDADKVDSSILLKERLLYKNVHWVLPNNANELQICHKTLANSVSDWNEKKYKPLIEIPQNDQKDIVDFKNYFKIPTNSKLICIHIRTSNFYKHHNKSGDDYRNSEIDTYFEAIDFLNSIGFYVIRIGEKLNNSFSFKLSNKNMFIDYPDTNFKSGKMDLILANESVFYVATDSGPHWYAGSLMKKLCIINSPLKDGFPYYKNTIFLPLKYKINKIEIHYQDILKLYTNCHFQWQFENNQIEIEKNNSHDIKKTIEESLFDCGLLSNYVYKNKNNLEKNRNNFRELNGKLQTNILSTPSEAYINRLNTIYK